MKNNKKESIKFAFKPLDKNYGLSFNEIPGILYHNGPSNNPIYKRVPCQILIDFIKGTNTFNKKYSPIRISRKGIKLGKKPRKNEN